MANKTKLTQKETIFYILYQSHKDTATIERFVPVFEFMGETYCKELGLWGFVSHECSARASEMKSENPQMFERKTIHGKSGAKYYGYRITLYPKPEMLKDEKLISFHKKIKPKKNDN